MPDIAASKRSCCFTQPSCQYGFFTSTLSLPSLVSTSGYHSPHLPAVQPCGLEGACSTCAASERAMRSFSHASTVSSTNTALGPASVAVGRTE